MLPNQLFIVISNVNYLIIYNFIFNQVLFETVLSPSCHSNYCLITMNRPKALNSLNYNMIQLMTPKLRVRSIYVYMYLSIHSCIYLSIHPLIIHLCMYVYMYLSIHSCIYLSIHPLITHVCMYLLFILLSILHLFINQFCFGKNRYIT